MKLRRLLFEGEVLRLMGFTVLIKPLAMVSQMLIARFFGASAQLDAYNFTLFLVTFLAQTVSAVFFTVIIPQITRIREAMAPDKVAAYQNAVIALYFIPVAAAMVFLAARGDIVIDLIGAKLPTETRDYAYLMIRILSLPVMLFCLVKVNSALLNLHKRFRLPAALLPMHTLFFLLGLVFLHGSLGIWALPASWILSYVVQSVIITVRALQTRAFRFVSPRLPQGEISVLWGLSWMVLFSQGMLMINTFVDKWFAAGLPVGSISHVTYAHTIINVGLQVFSMSLVVVVFTKMSELLASDDYAGCDRYLRANLVRVSNLVVPVCVALFIASPQVVRVLFQRGAFTAADALVTGQTLGMYLLGLPAMVINGLIARLYHSLQKMQERIWLALQYLVTNVVGNILLVKTLGTVGLAISSTVAINLHLLLSFIILRGFHPELRTAHYIAPVLSAYCLAAGALAIYHLAGAGAWLEQIVGVESTLSALLTGALKFIVFMGLYGILLIGWRGMRRQVRS